jgi:Na+/H+-dicarboxylate symporter
MRTTVNVTGDAVGVAIVDHVITARVNRAHRMPEVQEGIV